MVVVVAVGVMCVVLFVFGGGEVEMVVLLVLCNSHRR